MAPSSPPWTVQVAAALATLLTCPPVWATELTTIRDQDPALGATDAEPPQPMFHPRLKSLWLEALSRSESDLKRQAAEAIAKAHSLGMTGFDDAVPHLVAELESKDSRYIVRFAVARALIELDAKSAAPALMRFASAGGPDAARLVEPALARWDHAPMREVWLARLTNTKTPRSELVLAVQAVGVIKLTSAASHLRRLVLDSRTPGDIRLDAARALGIIQQSGLESEARTLAVDETPQHILDRLLAATLLVHHRGKSTQDVLLVLAGDREPTVAAVAVGRLLELDAKLLGPRLSSLAKNSDSTVRHLAAKVAAELKTTEAVELLGLLLTDPHRNVRVFARESLIRFAGTDELRPSVHRGVQGVISGNDARGLEQAAIVAGAIRYEPVADRLVRLLVHPAGEVRVASAWGLRRLAVPATGGPILDRVKALTEVGNPLELKYPDGVPAYRDLEHLIEALGVLRHKPADVMLRKYLPAPPTPPPPGELKPIWLPQLRAAAIWTLGHIHPTAPPELVTTLVALVQSQDAIEVRGAAAVALGRMKANAGLPVLREIFAAEKDDVFVRRCAGWAIGQVTSEMILLPPFPNSVRERWHTGWFLEPFEPTAPMK